MLGSIFREKLRFDGNEYRTPRLNEAAQLICQSNNKLRVNKNGKDVDFSTLSRPVLHKFIRYEYNLMATINLPGSSK